MDDKQVNMKKEGINHYSISDIFEMEEKKELIKNELRLCAGHLFVGIFRCSSELARGELNNPYVTGMEFEVDDRKFKVIMKVEEVD